MNKAIIWVFLVAIVTIVTSFEIVDIGVTPQHPRIGDSVRLKCKSDSSFEYCIWQHKDRVCVFEWKRNIDGVSKQVTIKLSNGILLTYIDGSRAVCVISLSF